MSFGKSSSSSAPVITQEQKDAIAAQTGMLTGTIIPTYQQAVKGATDVYNQNLGGVTTAGQNLSNIANQLQSTLGSTGESAARTGIAGLESLFNPDYEKNQIQAALAAPQAQYLQNLAGQQAAFGGTGNLGSARQALAQQQLAGSNMLNQAQIAAQVQQGIEGQRLQAANQLANLGASNLGQALGAAGQSVTAAMTPQQLYNQYASVIFGTPSASYTPDFRGTQGSNKTETNAGIKIGFGGPGGFTVGG
jgi:hypothetical protein